ncbi:H-2 class II histocompatibility antigen, E-D beta chain-like protein [Turdus rufiventris]|nr:H-2 class II histocompatibility antigen, E-D beta chain-like protein [Turdus rufiventris]
MASMTPMGHRRCGVEMRVGPPNSGGAGNAAPEQSPAHTGMFQEITKHECYFINGMEKVRYVQKHIYNRKEYARYDSEVGRYVGFTPYGERRAEDWNSDPEGMDYKRAAIDTYCRHNYEVFAPFSVECRGEREAERVSSGPAPAMTLEPLKNSLGITPKLPALPVPTPGPSVPHRHPREASSSSQIIPVHPSPSRWSLRVHLMDG